MMKPKQIADETQIPAGTVYGRLSNMQQAVIKEIGIDEIGLEEPLKTGFSSRKGCGICLPIAYRVFFEMRSQSTKLNSSAD
jgi:hypothetical protein